MSFASTSDIAFLLIIFFALAGKFTKTTDKPLELPSVTMGNNAEPRQIELVVTKAGLYYINDSKVQPEGLREEIEFYFSEDTDVAGRTVILRADRHAPYSAVSLAVEAVNQADAYLEIAVNHTE